MGMGPDAGASEMAGGIPPMATDEEKPEMGQEEMPLDEGAAPDMPAEPEGEVPEDLAEGEADVGEAPELPAAEDEETPLDEEMPEDIPEEEPAEDVDMDMGGEMNDEAILDDVAIELIRQGNRELAEQILGVADRLKGAGAVDVPLDEEVPEDMPAEGEYDDDEELLPADPEAVPISKNSPMDTPSADDMGESLTQSEGENADVKAKVGEIMAEAVGEVMDAIDGKDAEPEGEAEVEVEVIGEPESNEEKNDEIIDEEHIEECGCENVKKSSVEHVTFREMLEAKQRGEDAWAPFMKSSETDGFAEFDPYGRSRFDMFKKSADTIADEVADVKTNMQSNAKTGGDQLDEVDEEKGMTDGNVAGGDKLDEVDAERPSGNGGNGGDMIDEISKDDGNKNKQGETEDLLDTVDTEQPTGTSGQGGDMLDEVKKSAMKKGDRTLDRIAEAMVDPVFAEKLEQLLATYNKEMARADDMFPGIYPDRDTMDMRNDLRAGAARRYQDGVKSAQQESTGRLMREEEEAQAVADHVLGKKEDKAKAEEAREAKKQAAKDRQVEAEAAETYGSMGDDMWDRGNTSAEVTSVDPRYLPDDESDEFVQTEYVGRSETVNGKSIPTLKDMMSMKKSGRPDANTTANGEIDRPELGKIMKSSTENVRMGRGVDPKKVTENDWNEYNLFKSRQTF